MTTMASERSLPTTQVPVVGSRSRWDAVIRVSAAVTVWSSLLLVGYWWSAGGGFQALLEGWSDAFDSIGRLSGLIAAVLLLVQVILMARVPLLEHAYGQDRLARTHRFVGFTSFTLMLVH